MSMKEHFIYCFMNVDIKHKQIKKRTNTLHCSNSNIPVTGGGLRNSWRIRQQLINPDELSETTNPEADDDPLPLFDVFNASIQPSKINGDYIRLSSGTRQTDF